jgi:hypothetical protein
MATQTSTQAVIAHGDAPNQTTARVETDYDDALLRILLVRCVNNTPVPVSVTATKTSNGRTVSRTFAANTTGTQNVPQGAAGRLNISIDARGRMDGVEFTISFAP